MDVVFIQTRYNLYGLRGKTYEKKIIINSGHYPIINYCLLFS